MFVSPLTRLALHRLPLALLCLGVLACGAGHTEPSSPPEPPPPEHPEPPQPPEPPKPPDPPDPPNPPDPPPPGGEGKRVLFIGNSLTYYNDLPGMVKVLAAAAGEEDLVVHEVTFGGVSLEDHWHDGTARGLLSSSRWDFVVMQQGPSGAPESRAHLIRWVGQFNAPIRAAGARPAVYMVWPDITRQTAYDSVASNYTAAAAAIDAMLFPGVRTWQAIWARDPSLELYGRDGFHPSPLGTYAIAVLMVHQITGESVIGLPASLQTAAGVSFSTSTATALLVQQAAEEAARDHGRN